MWKIQQDIINYLKEYDESTSESIISVFEDKYSRDECLNALTTLNNHSIESQNDIYKLKSIGNPPYEHVEENSFTNEANSVSIGNDCLYNLVRNNPLNNNANGLLAKLWLIGRSYAASPERRTYSGYKQTGSTKLDLNTGSNGTDSFFLKLSKKMISQYDYILLSNMVHILEDRSYTLNENDDIDLLSDSIDAVLLFNQILRKAIIEIDEPSLIAYETATEKNPQNRKLRYFLSFSSKFMHFHLPNIVFILDSYSLAHSKKTVGNNYIYSYSNQLQIAIPKEDVKRTINLVMQKITFLSSNNEDNRKKEIEYIKHACRSYHILKILSEETMITPRMEDNFIMNSNLDILPTDEV